MRSEALWAQPKDAHEGGGTYELLNVSIFCALAPGDVVRAQINGESRLQITAVESFINRCVSGMTVDPEVFERRPSQEVLDHASVRLARRLEAQGAHVEGPGGALTCSWPRNMTTTQVWKRLSKALEAESGWTVVGVWSPEDRADWLSLALDATPVVGKASETSTYWAADDSRWEELGVDDPALLARIQTVATDSPDVMATIEAGLHENVLVFIERLDTPDIGSLPPLDGPLLITDHEGTHDE